MGKETISRTTFAKGVTAGVIVAASLGILSIGDYSIKEIPVASEGNGSYTPGTYTASAAGISSDVTVTCTFNETTITSIEADVSGETAGIGAEIGDTMVGKVLSEQTAEVDAESGATITSEAFKAAVADCIAQASGETVAAAETEAEAAETEAGSEAEEASEAAETEAVEESAADTAASAGGSYVAGTYTASAAGISSDVTVTCTFDGTSITAIEADVSGETAGIGAEIGDTMVEKVLAAQSADVDAESGATVTSEAFKAAVADCIAQASGGAAESTQAEEASEAVETETEAVEESAADTAASAGGSYVAGTYTASAAGISSDVTVTCTFDGTSITAIEADVSGETAGIGAEIGDTMVEKVLAAQSADVDAESGATVTSEAFKAAVADCIAQASGGAAESTQAEEASEAVETETEAATEAAETETEEVTEAAETETEEVTEAAETETEEITEVAETETEATDADSSATETEFETTDADSSATETETESELTDADSSATETEFETELINPLYIEGEYTATADGYDSEILVTVTVDANSILSIEADVSGEPDNYGGLTDETLEKLILAAQSADVDGVSGATVTSDAIKAAAADCLEQAAAPAEDETEAGTSYKPGTYTASAAGISSDVTVTCTFDETSITAIEADVSGETAGIGAAIGDDMIDAVLAAQSADVDAVSGATITSEAFMTAVADCMEQAKAE